MKLYANLLALCALHPLAASAFVTPASKFALKPSVELYSTPPLGPGAAAGLPGTGLTGPGYATGGEGAAMRPVGDWDEASMLRVEGSTLRTWTFRDTTQGAVTCVLETDGRPLNADIQLWIGPDWTPYSMKVYSEDGRERPIRTLIGTRYRDNAIAVRNTASMEFPLDAALEYAKPPLADITKTIPSASRPVRVQGGAVYTTPFVSAVDRVQVLLNTDGRQLNARVELLNGPNNIKQTVECFTNNGEANPLYITMESPGSGNVVRIVNTGTVEFPLEAWISEA